MSANAPEFVPRSAPNLPWSQVAESPIFELSPLSMANIWPQNQASRFNFNFLNNATSLPTQREFNQGLLNNIPVDNQHRPTVVGSTRSSAFDEIKIQSLQELEALYQGFKVKPDFNALYSGQQRRQGRRGKVRKQPATECAFCKNNGESIDIYTSHVLKDSMGNVSCPVLRYYNCPICNNGGGDDAHTIRYCPLNTPKWKKKLLEQTKDRAFSL